MCTTENNYTYTISLISLRSLLVRICTTCEFLSFVCIFDWFKQKKNEMLHCYKSTPYKFVIRQTVTLQLRYHFQLQFRKFYANMCANIHILISLADLLLLGYSGFIIRLFFIFIQNLWNMSKNHFKQVKPKMMNSVLRIYYVNNELVCFRRSQRLFFVASVHSKVASTDFTDGSYQRS